MTPWDLFRSTLDADPARPFVTFYDDATGERVELSVTTVDNWVAKTAGLFQDGLAAEPGQRVSLLLPTHWQTQVLVLACWAIGLIAAPDADPAGADLVVCGPEGLDAAHACPGERIALSLAPLGARFREPPEGFTDYAAEVPGYPDRFLPIVPPEPGQGALEVEGRLLTAEEVAAEAKEAAEGLAPGDRLLCARQLSTWEGIRAGLLAPLAAGVPVVLCRNLDPARLPARTEQERVTRVLGPTSG